ncbi:MAG: sugar ABC transporter ATP-binding protein [Christensenellales bacterium]
MIGENLVEMRDITKSFPGVLALDNVHFELNRGEVHVLLGENGAGKSTLMKILSGVYHKDSGTILYKGKEVNIENVHQAQELGISIIYQELNVSPYLTVAENIYIGRQPMKAGRVDWKKMYADAQQVLDELQVNIHPKTIVKNLTIAQQQMVEVARAISKNVDVLIMDEPTSSLTEHEIEQLFRTIRELTAKGVGIIYISHRLEELREVGDRATVFRDGRFVETVNFNQGEVDLDYLIKLMVGRDLKDKFPKEEVPIGEEVFRVENVSCDKTKVKECSFHVRSGEILGFSGLMGAGRTELMRAAIGADARDGGDIYLNGKKIQIRNFGDAVKNRIGFLTEDRKGQGLVLIFDVKSNITLAGLDKIIKRKFLDLRKERDDAQKLSEALDIKTPSLKQKVKFLSGGNQQKVVLAKWLFTDCDILIFDEPTRGIDVGAKTEIYKLMTELARRGVAIIMISSELPEILGMSDRIYVMHEGKITGELQRNEADQEKILKLATGGK